MVRAPRFTVNGPNAAVFTSDTHDDIQESELAQLASEPNQKKSATGWAEYVLASSIRQLGVVVPTLYLRRELLDGARRERLAESLGVPCPRLLLTSETQAARLLWRFHPERAWARFVRRGMRRTAIADLFGVELSELPDRRARWIRT